MGDYSSFYKYEKFEIIGDELVPLGIFSVDGNGTMPLVIKDDCDPQCGCPEPIYRWIQTEDTVCIEVITYKLQATYSDSSTLNVECNSSTSLLKAESQPTGYTASAMTDAIIGDCVTTIGDSYYYTQAPFMNCYSLSSVTIPSSVTTIARYAFYGCSGLTSITIPSGVTSIYEAAFSRCSGLTAIYVEPTTPPALYGSEPFWNTGDCPIYVPCESVSAYQSAWSTYASRIEGIPPCSKYRWVAIGTTCSNGNKYQNNVKQVSTDGGHTWTDVVPAEYSASTLIESDSYDCGYRTGTTSSSTYCNGDDLYVDVYYRVSRDTGTTWTTASTTPTLVEAGGCATPTPKVRHIIYDAETATKGYPAILRHGSSYAQDGRFSDSEGTYFPSIPMEVYEMLCTNNIPLMVEFSQVNETNTLGRVMTGWWSPIYYENLPISTEEPLAIYITLEMLDTLSRNLVLFNGLDTTQDIIVTKVYYEV